jgi:hypothetical protein
MSAKIAFGAFGALLLGSVAAQASDATLLADRAGFLVGSAHRCGIEAGRVERAAALSDRLIAAFSTDDDDKDAARTHFTEHVLASALAKLLGDPAPSCALVRSQLTELEQHSPAVAAQNNQGLAELARVARPGGRATSSAVGKPGKSKVTAMTRREEPPAGRRSAVD